MMAPRHCASTPALEPLTAEERWRRWQQRGVDNDVRVRDRFQRGVWVALLMASAILFVWVSR